MSKFMLLLVGGICLGFLMSALTVTPTVLSAEDPYPDCIDTADGCDPDARCDEVQGSCWDADNAPLPDPPPSYISTDPNGDNCWCILYI